MLLVGSFRLAENSRDVCGAWLWPCPPSDVLLDDNVQPYIILHSDIGLHETQLDVLLLLYMERQHSHPTHPCHSRPIAALHTLMWRQSVIIVQAKPCKEVFYNPV